MRRVLVVDPAVSSRCAIATQLVHRGYDVATAATKESALSLARVAPPILALVHHDLPGAMGLVLALERLPTGPIPVVILRGPDLDDVFAADEFLPT